MSLCGQCSPLLPTASLGVSPGQLLSMCPWVPPSKKSVSKEALQELLIWESVLE